MGYQLFCAAGLSDGLERLRHVFVALLVETSKEFALRNVPRVADAARDLGAAAMAAAAPMPDVMPRLQRSASSEARERERLLLQAPALVRELSQGAALERFSNMRSWEDSEHPIVMWYEGRAYEGEVEGLDILSLNPRFLDRYIDRALNENLKLQVRVTSLGGPHFSWFDNFAFSSSSSSSSSALLFLPSWRLVRARASISSTTGRQCRAKRALRLCAASSSLA
jgi:hypothetical protein